MHSNDLHRVIGFADSCELLSALFTFPDENFAAGLANGSVREDVVACMSEIGADAKDGGKPLEAFEGGDDGELYSRLRKGFSILYFAPNQNVPVQPYESPFMHISMGYEGHPVLFRSACTLDVERHMREAGVLPKEARKEPSDSVWNELSFMSFLYGSLAAALHEEQSEDALMWDNRIVRFWDEHASLWLPAFMEKTGEEASKRSFGSEYAVFSKIGLSILAAIGADVEARKREG